MARETLTDLKIRKARPAKKGQRYDLWDALVPGLSLRVTDRGAKSWTVVGRLNGKALRVTIGPYPALGVAAARVRARSALEMLADGKNPRRSRRTTPTVKTALDDYLKTRKWLPRYRANVESAMRLYIRPAFDDMLVVDVERRDVTEWIRELTAKHPARAHSVLSHLKTFFEWAHDGELIQVNPCVRMRAPSELVKRDRVYSDPEIRAIWRACETKPLRWPYGPMVKFLLVTAQRREQASAMKRDQVDDARGIWTSPTKEKRLHPIPLSDLAREILTDAPKRGAFVFSVTGERGTTNFSYIGRKMKEAEGVPDDFRLHDLRRTAATRMAELGVHPRVIDAVLDHVAGGVSGIYNRYAYVDEMRQALALWSGRLREILAVPTSSS